ncbi:serine/threonine-protein phosphatase 7 long form homolog [Bidens hawaiensis]|uniref:serine/threonine-protein phosphatase 7 long form homolog n=1 Tax=Bidens hawaiensis TaxID=980011 RepID=UPI00404B88C6
MTSIYDTPCNQTLVKKLSQFWYPKTNTFVFPWGEATVTLEDVTVLGGYSVLGESVISVDSVDSVTLNPDLAGKVEIMNGCRSELGPEPDPEDEHIAFLSLWLSRFVFPSVDLDSVGKHVIPIAVRLSQGVKLALAPAVLAYIYCNLTKLKEQKSNVCVNLLGPFRLVQIWGYERFQLVGPNSITPNELRPGEPRLAHWHALNPLTINLESFIWRPYVVDLQNWTPSLYYQDSEQVIIMSSDSMILDDDLRSFVCFITPCELNGLDCKARYYPHRVAMQFGYDQDIPGDVFSYKVSKFVKFFVPLRLFEPGVTKRYYDWWKNVDRTGLKNEQDSSLGDEENCDKKSDEEFDDILVSLKKICDATKRKISSLKESCVGVAQTKKVKLGGDVHYN